MTPTPNRRPPMSVIVVAAVTAALITNGYQERRQTRAEKDELRAALFQMATNAAAAVAAASAKITLATNALAGCSYADTNGLPWAWPGDMTPPKPPVTGPAPPPWFLAEAAASWPPWAHHGEAHIEASTNRFTNLVYYLAATNGLVTGPGPAPSWLAGMTLAAAATNVNPYTVEAMAEAGVLTNVVKELAAAGSICRVLGHHNWRPGRPGEGEGSPHGGWFADYHPGTAYRSCRVCGVCESQLTAGWE